MFKSDEKNIGRICYYIFRIALIIMTWVDLSNRKARNFRLTPNTSPSFGNSFWIPQGSGSRELCWERRWDPNESEAAWADACSCCCPHTRCGHGGKQAMRRRCNRLDWSPGCPRQIWRPREWGRRESRVRGERATEANVWNEPTRNLMLSYHFDRELYSVSKYLHSERMERDVDLLQVVVDFAFVFFQNFVSYVVDLVDDHILFHLVVVTLEKHWVDCKKRVLADIFQR